jgi:cyclopropane fatty-acyl-phospholipid synthase-like methyltransferase
MPGEPLSRGNTAKLYCLQLIERAAAETDGDFRILDLGCGTGSNFLQLLRRRPNARYIGVEPSRTAAAQARQNLPDTEIHNRTAYGISVDPVHAVVSFSVLEHVVDRPRYFEAIRGNVRPDGRVFLNYDSGHFVADANPVERAKTLASHVLARLGSESRYRARVRDDEFRSLAETAGLKMVDDKFFNTELKRFYRFVPEERRDSFMERWLAFELELNGLGLEFRDDLASLFRTRNVVLRPV